VVRRLAAAQVVVVHRRQVVVDERHGVNHFESYSSRLGGIQRAAEHLGRGKAEHGAHSLAAGQQRVAHRLDDQVSLRDGGLERGVEELLGKHTLLLHVDAEVEFGCDDRSDFTKALLRAARRGLRPRQDEAQYNSN
jgi:hypothetical protein